MAPTSLHLMLLTVTLLPLAVSCAQTNITLGSSLKAAAGAAWSSPSGRFAFGFYSTAGGLAIGVWLATAPNITVVWTANRIDTPTSDGWLQLNHGGHMIWWSGTGPDRISAAPAQPAVVAAMRDDGNFVLYGEDTSVVWSTFASPTDTLLVGQDLQPGAQLFAGLSDADKATGKYRLTNQNDGNLVLYPVGTTNEADSAYWSSETSFRKKLTMRLDASGVLYLVNNNGSYSNNFTQPKAPQDGTQVYYRATLDSDGILRVYGHVLMPNGVWTTNVQWVAPSDRCSVKGVCGLNSYCVLDHNAQPSCSCPPGFSFVDASNARLGCMANYSAYDCSARAHAGFSMAALANVSWTEKSYWVLTQSTSAADCQVACLSDCFCTAVQHNVNDGKCTKQLLPLLYGPAVSGYTLYVKTSGPATQPPGCSDDDNRRAWQTATIALACIVLLAFLSLSAVFASWRLLWTKIRVLRRTMRLAVAADATDEDKPLRSYTYRELEQATYSFRDPLGRGAFGTVFKGTLYNGAKTIAVKRLEKLVEDGEQEFQREVRSIGRANHRNLVRLLGFCHEAAHRLLVYEFMSNGSLADHLFKSASYPTWADRIGAALDVARGLHYLHDEMESRVIHCDVKPQNILMDAAGTAKIADFGLAKLLLPDQTRTFTDVRGTRGYLAPEWYRGAGPLTVKADVYSYGVVLLEIVTCRRSMEMEEAGEERTLMEWVHECLVSGELQRVMGSNEVVEETAVERVVKVGMWCVQGEPQSRPSMKNVILMLEGHLEVSFPPPPPSFS